MDTLTYTVLDIDSPYSLSDAQVERFRRDGCIKLKQVLSPAALAHYGSAITRLTIDLNTEVRPLQERSTYDRAFLQVMNLWEQSPLVGRFVMGQRLARMAAELLQVSGVRLYHDQSLYKEPGGGITPAHADQYYWPLASDRTITAWIPLQAVPAEMGPLGFYAGSQAWPSGETWASATRARRTSATTWRGMASASTSTPSTWVRSASTWAGPSTRPEPTPARKLAR